MPRLDGMRYQLAETDLFDDMLETGFQQTHNLAVSGGTKGLSYRMSAGIGEPGRCDGDE